MHHARLIQGLAAALALTTAAAMVYRAEHLPGEPYLGMSERGAAVALVAPGGPAEKAGLRAGDRITAIDGVAARDLRSLSAALRGQGPGRGLSLVYERDGEMLRTELVPESLPLSELFWKLAHAAVALGVLLIGTVVVVHKPGRLTVVFYTICLALGNLLFRTSVLPHGWGYLVEEVAQRLFADLLPGLLLHFFLLFPFQREALQKRPWLHLAPYLPGVLLFALESAEPAAALGLPVDALRPWLETLGGLYTLAALVLSVILFARAYRGSPLPTIRRKLKVTLAGTLLGLVPLLAVMAVHLASPGLRIPGDRVATLMIVFLPASFGYAILRHGLFEMESLAKRGLVYSGMTATLILAYFVAYFVLNGLLHNVPGLSGRIGSLLAVVFAALLMSPLRGRLQVRIDRWVYPDRYEISRALREAANLLREAAGTDGVEKALLQSVRLLLGTEQAALFRASSDETYRLSAVLDPSALPPGSAQAQIGRLLADPLLRGGEPVTRGDLEAELPYGFLPQRDLEALTCLKAQVLIPLASGSRRLGILILGPRSYDEPYSAPDLELLEGLQAQGVLAMENALYLRESQGRADLDRELEVARALQQQLLPRELPQIPSMEIAASNLPCHQIGGDYYDCLQTDGRDLTLAIGDVSGKGVPAALLMANVQATFRAEIASGRAPHEVLERMNRRLCALERPERFVSFFCGRLDLRRHHFSYANAGHLQPMLIRREGLVDRLDRGGLLLGIHEGASYEGGTVPLRPGDLLLLFTDGVVERGGASSLFGEADLQSVASRNRHLSAADLVGRILEDLERATGTVADDDTTLLVLKAL